MTLSQPILRLDTELIQHCSEMSLLVTLDAALAAVEATLWEQHHPESELLLDPQHTPEPACLTAHLVASSATRLRHLLRLHLAEIKRVFPPDDHLF